MSYGFTIYDASRADLHAIERFFKRCHERHDLSEKSGRRLF